MSVIYFRCDGNKEIATGHIMRCLSIARACAVLHAEIVFLVSDEESTAVLNERFAFPNEFFVRCLHSDYHDMEAELPALQSIITETHNVLHPVSQSATFLEEKVSTDSFCLFVDSYFVTETYLSRLRQFVRVAYLDDVLAFDYPVDLIINYDIDRKPSCYRKIGRMLLGAAYTPLREQFQNVPYEVRPEVRNILISTGGTDAYNVAGTFLKSVFTLTSEKPLGKNTDNECHYHVITSRLNTHFEELEELASLYPVIHIHENVQNMAELMCQCDLALSAGGTTLCELCAVGVPAISFVTADNQLSAVGTFSGKGIIPYAGDARSSLEKVINIMNLFLKEHAHSYERRKKSSQCMRAYIDGSGAARIAAELISL